MTKLFKNSKSILSLVLAFAVLAVSLFTGVAIHADAASSCDVDVQKVVYYGGGDGVAPTKGTGAENDPYIIETAENLLYIVKNGIATEKKYYKVSDDVDAFVLQTKSKIDTAGGIEELMNLDVAGTMAWFDDVNKTATIAANGGWGGQNFNLAGNTKGVTWQNWNKNTSGTTPFMGHFDGNGVTIYGMVHTGSGSLFGTVKGATIENINMKSCYVTGYTGGMISDSSAGAKEDKNTFNNISLTECCLLVNTQSGDAGGKVPSKPVHDSGLLCGRTASQWIHINGCYVNNCLGYNYVYDRADDITNPTGQTVGDSYFYNDNGWKANGNTVGLVTSFPNDTGSLIENSVVIGVMPYRSSYDNIQYGGAKNDAFSSIYTDAPAGKITWSDDLSITYTEGEIKHIELDALKGEAAVAMCPGLDWKNTWFANDGAPVLRSAHNIVQSTENKHLEACAECGMQGVIATDHNYVDRKCTICDDTLDCGEGVIYWNGTASAPANATGAAGTKDDPIIITSAEELNYIVTQRQIPNDNGKWYKIADHIDTIVLQPKGVVDLDTLKACADANAVKTYLSGLEGLKNWNNGATSDKYFNGNFDGNGVEIYGLYSENLTTGGATGLFLGVEPWFPAEGNWTLTDGGKTYYYDTNLDEPVVLQNFAIKNSYYVSARRAGAIIGMTGSPNYGTNYTGSIKISGCEVSNCYMEAAEGSNAAYKGEQGLLLGAVDSDHFTVDNCLVYGNVTKDVDGNPFTIYANRSAFKAVPTEKNGNMFSFAAEDPIIENVTSNSIILGVEPYATGSKAGNRNCATACFENVYTDAPAGEIDFGGSTGKITYTDEQIKNVSGLTGAELVAACDALDWEKTFLVTTGMPEFRAMHDEEFDIEKDYSGHKITCSCGLVVADGTHNYNKEFTCTDCGFVCDHGSDEHITATPNESNCLTAPSNHNKCACGFEEDVPTGDVPGHTFTDVGEIPSENCQTQGTAAYRYCTVCDKKYAADADTLAAFDTALTDEELKLPVADHNHATDKDGVAVYIITEAGHQKVCGTCNKAYGDVESHIGAPVANGAAGHKITCTVAGCGYAAENAPHNFGDDNVCDTCEWTCSAHTYADGEAIELTIEQRNDPAYKDVCSYVEQICTICGHKGENRIVAHTAGDWETKQMMDMNKVPACAGEGSHTEIKICTVCFSTVDERIVTDPKTGHAFDEFEAFEPNCLYEGEIAHKYCPNCNYSFAMDAADDEPYENALTDEELYIPADPEAHAWVEYKAGEADCENDGYTKDHKFCATCLIFVIEDETTDFVVDYEEFYKYEYESEEDMEGTPVGFGAIADAYAMELYDELFAQYLAELGVELPEEPAEDASFEEWDAYYEEYFAIMDTVDTTEFEEAWAPVLEAIFNEAYHQYFLAAAAADEENPVELVIPAVGHKLEEVKEVPATYEKDGVKAHYACECGKLYSDAEGKNEVKAEELVIAKLVKEEEKPADKPADKPAGDDSDKSPVTGDSVASVAAVAALMGAAFVLVRKSKKS